MGTHYTGNDQEIRALNAYIKLLRAAESVSSRVHARLGGERLTTSQFGVIDALYHLGPLTQGDLGRKILKSSGNITMVVDNLEKRGLIRRVRSEHDRRSYSISLSRSGRNMFEKILPGHVAAIVQELDVLLPDEQDLLGSLCRRIGAGEGAQRVASPAKGKEKG